LARRRFFQARPRALRSDCNNLYGRWKTWPNEVRNENSVHRNVRHMVFTPCNKLAELESNDFKRLLRKRLSLEEVKTLWSYVFQARLEDDFPGRNLDESVDELYRRAEQRNLIPKLFEELCKERPDICEDSGADADSAPDALALYRERLSESVRTVNIFGVAEPFELEHVFVSLTVVDTAEVPPHSDFFSLCDPESRIRRGLRRLHQREDEEDDEKKKKPAPKVVAPDELLKPGVRAMTSGAPGCGKTTLLRWLTRRALHDDTRFPVLVELKSVADFSQPLQEILFASVLEQCGGEFALADADKNRLREHFSAALRDGRLSVFLDGLDEIVADPNFLDLCKGVERFACEHVRPAGCSLVVSARPYALRGRFLTLTRYEIAPLDDRQIAQFLDGYFKDAPEAARLKKDVAERPNVKELARVPALLGVLVGLTAAGDAATDSRLTLYQKIFDRLTGDDDRERNVERIAASNALCEDADFSVRRDFARFVAFERLFDPDPTARFRFSRERLHAAAERFCEAKPATLGKYGVPLANWLAASPLLRETGADEYAFLHLTIQEFLAAQALVAKPDCERRLCAATFDAQLAELETLPMALGLAKNPDELYAALEALPESLDFANLRVRARGLAYAGDALAQIRIDALADRFMEFFHEKVAREENPYRDAVMESFSNTAGRVQCVLADKLLAILDDARDDNLDWRMRAVETLGNLGARTPNVIEKLTILYQKPGTWPFTGPDPDKWLWGRAVVALEKLGELPPDEVANPCDDLVVESVADALNRHKFTEELFKKVWKERGTTTPDAEEVATDVTVSLANLCNDTWGARYNAAVALWRIAEQSPDFFRDGLHQALTDDDFNARHIAARVIGYYDQDEATLRTLEDLASNDLAEDIRAVARDAAARYKRKLALFA
jgi:HEAT repeat protein